MLTCRERKRRKWLAAPTGFFCCRAERDSWNVSERIHWMKKWGSCRENLQLWPPFLTPVPFLWMINLCVVQRSHLQYDSHRSAENATSSPKIPQLSIYCYHLTSRFHGQMISHTSSSLELNLKPLYVFWQIYALLLSQSHLCTVFSLLVQPQLVGKWLHHH